MAPVENETFAQQEAKRNMPKWSSRTGINYLFVLMNTKTSLFEIKSHLFKYYSAKDKLRHRAQIVVEVEEGAIVEVDTGVEIEDAEIEELEVVVTTVSKLVFSKHFD